MFSIVTGRIAGHGSTTTLYAIYGLGFASMFAVMLLMYVHAWRRREQLELNEVELWDTQTEMMFYAAYIMIGLLSTAIGSVPGGRLWAGLIYFMIGPASAAIGWIRGYKRMRVEERYRARQGVGFAISDPDMAG